MDEKTKRLVIGEIKDGQGGKFTPNQKEGYFKILASEHFRIVNPEMRSMFEGARSVAMTLYAEASSRAMRSTSARTGIKLIGGAITILGSPVVMAADLFLTSNDAGRGSDCVACFINRPRN